ncbi:MAG: SDR family oxidoreductase [Acidobacteria bacterium]|nr:SDR family oxidoreductase [Acidobacteriota bacterium]
MKRMRRANEHGWPNTYTFTKSLAESLIGRLGADLPISIVRPSIVETSTHEPFEGWNEGVNTSAPISYLLGTFFRQMPTNGKKCLDIVPVDLVCRGMILISAALIARKHELMYQLATSAVNPCNMRRTIELTGLAHRKHYKAQDDFNRRVLAYFDTIPVSKERYQKLSAPRQKQIHSVAAMDPFTAPNGTVPARQTPEISTESKRSSACMNPSSFITSIFSRPAMSKFFRPRCPKKSAKRSATMRATWTGGTTG